MRYLFISVLLLIGANALASEKSISITIKPSAGIVGTVSFNVHPDDSVTVLVYESTSKISESSVIVDRETVVKIRQLSERALIEFNGLSDYSQIPEYKQGSAIMITQNKVTKSISTHRYSEQLISLIQMLKPYIPEGYDPQLEKK